MKFTTSRIALAALTAIIAASTLTACTETDADTVSRNLSTDAEQFKIVRRIVFVNGITDKYLLEIEGRCSVESADSALAGGLEVTCKTGPGKYAKHFLGLSNNVTYLVQQMESAPADPYHHKIIFKPESILPDIELHTSNQPDDTDYSDTGVKDPTPAPTTAPQGLGKHTTPAIPKYSVAWD